MNLISRVSNTKMDVILLMVHLKCAQEKYSVSREKKEDLREEKKYSWSLKDIILLWKKEKEKEKKEIANNKLMIKKERLKELDIENAQKRKKIVKKIQKMEKRKLEFDKKKVNFIKK